MFKTRLLSGILLVIIALATIISGGYVLFFTLLAVSLIGMWELYRVMKVQDEKCCWQQPAMQVQYFIMRLFYWTLRDMVSWRSFSDWS